MIKKEMSIKRCLIAASMAGTMVLSSIPAVPVFAATDTADDGKVLVVGDSDRIFVEGYSFYTTTKPTAKKIPSSDKWTLAGGYYWDEEDDLYGAKVDLSAVKKATTYYFAESPNPKSLNDIIQVTVPKKEKAEAYKYKPGQEKANNEDTKSSDVDKAIASFDKLTKDMEYSIYSATAEEFSPVTYTYTGRDKKTGKEIEVTDSSLPYYLEKAKEEGGTFYFRSAGTVASMDATKSTDTTKMTEVTLDKWTRPGVAKAVKVAKRAKGPAASVDYASHTVKVKKGSSYIVLDEFDTYGDEREYNIASWNAVPDSKKFEEVDAAPDAIIAVRTAASDKKIASQTTYVHVDASAEATFSDTKAKVAIVGEFEGDATLQIVSDTEKEAFQYAFTDSTKNIGTIFTKDGFSYAGAAALKWKSVKTKADKTGTAKIAKNSSKGQFVLVRKAATGSVFSSNVMVFKAPEKAGEGWKFVSQENYDDTLTKASMAPALSFKYDASKNAVKIVVTGSGDATVVSGKKITAKTSKSEKWDANTTDNSFKAPDNSKVIKKDEVPASGTITLTVPKGTIEYTVDGVKLTNQAATYTVSFTNKDRWDATPSKTENPKTEEKDEIKPTIQTHNLTKASTVGTESAGGNFEITFSEELDSTSSSGWSITPSGVNNMLTGFAISDIQVSSSKVTFKIKSGNSMASTLENCMASDSITFTVSGFKDKAGNLMDSDSTSVVVSK